jgi:hypothetical protein
LLFCEEEEEGEKKRRRRKGGGEGIREGNSREREERDEVKGREPHPLGSVLVVSTEQSAEQKKEGRKEGVSNE